MRTNPFITSIIILSAIFISLLCPLLYPDEFSECPFSNKLIFSETPDIGKKWRGGIRMTDILIWDIYWNINNWLTLNLLSGGLPEVKEKAGGTLKDKLSVFTIKSLPYTIQLKGHTYRVGGGIKAYKAEAEYGDSSATWVDREDNSLVLFITQGHRMNKHYFNLFTSLSFREDQKKSTYYLIPAYQIRLSKSWSFALEYYMTNSRYVPFKFLQMDWEKLRLETDNWDRELYSFMFFGFQYTRSHLRVDLNLATHYSFQGWKVPIIGIGWNF